MAKCKDIIAEHATPEERAAYAQAIINNDGLAVENIREAVKKRLRKPRTPKAPSTKRIDNGTMKWIQKRSAKFGTQQAIDSIKRVIEQMGQTVVPDSDHA